MPRDVDGEWQSQESFVLSGMPQVQVWDHQRSGHFLETRGLFVIHAALLHTGKVLCFSGHAERLMYAPVCYVFDPENPSTPMQAIDFPPGADMFCCGLVQLRDGKILAVGGSQHDLVCQMSAANFGQSDPVDRAICTIIDAALPGLTPAQRLETLSHQDAHTFTVYRGSRGSKTIAYFTPEASGRGGRWTKARVSGKDLELAEGRWYPTTVALSDGRVAVFSGRREMTNAATSPGFIAETVEIVDPRASRWTVSTVAIKDSAGNPAPDLPLPTYPGMHLAADGKIFHTFTSWGQEIDSPSTTVSFSLTGSTANGTWTAVTGQAPSQPRREEGMSVLLPPAQDARILVVGGAFAQNRQAPPRGLLHHTTPAGQNGIANFGRISNTSDPMAAEVLTTSSGSWTNAGTMAFGRVNGHCVLLPDSTVFLCGGHDNYKWRPLPTTPPGAIRGTTPSMTSEIFTPGSSSGTGTFRTADSMIHPPLLPPDPRMYHSVALLLPDGSVFTAGARRSQSTRARHQRKCDRYLERQGLQPSRHTPQRQILSNLQTALFLQNSTPDPEKRQARWIGDRSRLLWREFHDWHAARSQHQEGRAHAASLRDAPHRHRTALRRARHRFAKRDLGDDDVGIEPQSGPAGLLYALDY